VISLAVYTLAWLKAPARTHVNPATIHPIHPRLRSRVILQSQPARHFTTKPILRWELSFPLREIPPRLAGKIR
jgi:hypothetical protein